MSDQMINEEKFLSLRDMVLIGVMCAVTCVLGPISIPLPFSPVPISLTNFVICISAYVLGTKKGTLSCILYLLIGLAGLPVFSGFSGGAAKMLGPTGGYLIGFIFQAVIAGLFIDRFPKKRLVHILGMAAGVACCYLFGTLWLAHESGNTFLYSILIGVVPYLPGDAVKIAAASLIGPKLRQAVRRGREA